MRQQVGGPQRRGHRDPGGQDLRRAAALLGRFSIAVHPAQEVLDIEVFGLCRLRIGLVVDRDVEVHVLRVLTEHPCQTVFDDVGDLVGEGGVVGHHCRVGRRQQQGVAVGVLQAFAGQGGPARGGAQHKAACHLIGGRPEAIAGALETEHRVEDVHRDHRLVVGRIRRSDGRERGCRARLVDALVQDLAFLTFFVGQHQLGVDRGVELTVAVVDLQAREP